MGKITVMFRLSKDGQKASILAGGDGKAAQSLDATDCLGDLKRRILAISDVDSAGNVVLEVEVGPKVRLGPPIPKGVEQDIHGAPWLAIETSAFHSYIAHPDGMTSDGFDSPQDLDDLVMVAESLHAKRQAHAEKVAASNAELKARQEELRPGRDKAVDEYNKRMRQERTEARHRRIEKAQARLEAMKAWVDQHGSPRLKAAKELGYLESSMGVYRDERLALERPGWRRDKDWFDGNVEHLDVLNPSLEDLEWLRKTREDLRAKDPSADPELSYAKYLETDEYGYDDDSEPVFEGTFLVDRFMGDLIVLLK